MKKKFNNLRADLPSSIVVFFVALPLCLGIALASGAPLFSGIIAGIIGGIIVGAASGSNLGVSGPAAGLAVIVFTNLQLLGNSWESFLVAIILAGIFQIILGFLRLGNIAYYFPSAVIKGMLTGIGLLIIIKQIPHALGYDKNFSADFGSEELQQETVLQKLSECLNYFTLEAIVISIISLLILILWESSVIKKHKISKLIQAPFLVVIVGIIFSNFFQLGENQIVAIPTATNFGEFTKLFTFPDFTQLRNLQIYEMALVIAIVASLETLLCVEATDKLDPKKRITPTNRELKAQGLGNIISGFIGGLPITQVVVRSSANISFGAKTKNSAILHGFFLLISAIAIPNLLNMIPLASLACILIAVGYKLAKPQIFRQVYKLGLMQFLPFVITIIAMIATDLLKGVMLGMAAAICFILYGNLRNSYQKISDEEGKNNRHIIHLAQEVSFLNKGSILQMLNALPPSSSAVIDGTKSKFIDHDVIEIIEDFRANAKSKNITLEIVGVNKKTW